MNDTGRFYLCARCRCAVVLCSRCDRGNRYCAGGCASAARRDSNRRAGRRYAESRRGRFNHAARQRRYRERQQPKVTQQGSAANGGAVSWIRPYETRSRAPKAGNTGMFCAICARMLDAFVRLRFLNRDRHSVRPPVLRH